MANYTGRKIGSPYGSESLIIYAIGKSVSIARDTYAPHWCKEKGMRPTYTVTAGQEHFTIWTGMINSRIGGTIEAACAIPV